MSRSRYVESDGNPYFELFTLLLLLKLFDIMICTRCLGHVLFSIYINDFEEEVKRKILIFADDTKLFRKNKKIVINIAIHHEVWKMEDAIHFLRNVYAYTQGTETLG